MFKDLFVFNYMYACVCEYGHPYRSEASESLELELHAAVSWLICVLGAELGSFAGAIIDVLSC